MEMVKFIPSLVEPVEVSGAPSGINLAHPSVLITQYFQIMRNNIKNNHSILHLPFFKLEANPLVPLVLE